MKIAHFSVVALPFMLLAACGGQAPQSVADQQSATLYRFGSI